MSKRKQGSDIEFEDNNGNDDPAVDEEDAAEDREEEADEQFVPDDESKPKKKAKTKPSTGPAARPTSLIGRRNRADTAARATVFGGYAHTLDSKMKISMANRGNTPWNKGKNRSAADRAKIAAGVRARNRAILLEKLSKIGMSEDEWHEKKKQLKHLRERVRRAKKAKDDKALEENQKKLDAALADQNKVTGQTSELENKTALKNKPAAKAKKAKKAKEASPPPLKPKKTILPPKAKIVQADSVSATRPNDQENIRLIPAVVTQPINLPKASLKAFFAKDVDFSSHEFDSSELENPYETCPNGGPGGLICCAACTKKYSGYLTSSAKDIEQQKTKKVNKEVTELLGFLSGAKARLGEALKLAKQRTKNGPLHQLQQPMVVNQDNTLEEMDYFSNSQDLDHDQSESVSMPATMPALPQLVHQEDALPQLVHQAEELVMQIDSAVEAENSEEQAGDGTVLHLLLDPCPTEQLTIEPFPNDKAVVTMDDEAAAAAIGMNMVEV